MNRIKNLLAILVKVGVLQHFTPDLARRISTTNFYAIILSSASLIVSGLLLFLKIKVMGFLAFLVALGFMAVPLFNLRQMPKLAKISLVLIFNLAIYTFSTSLGGLSGTHLWFITAAILPFGIFRLEDLSLLVPSAILPTVLFLFVWTTHFTFLIGPKVETDSEAIDVIAIVMISLSFLADFLITFIIAELAKNYRNRFEEALILSKKSEKSFREIYENVPTGIVKLDMNRKFISANPAFEKILGYSESELQNMTTPQITHPEDQAASNQGARIILAEGPNSTETNRSNESLKNTPAAVTVEKRYLHKSGHYIFTRASALKLEFKDGEEHYFLVVIEDISHQKLIDDEKEKLQLQLRESFTRALRNEKSFRMIFEHSPIGMFRLNADLKFISVNLAFANFLGYSEVELKNMTIVDISHPDDQKTTLERASLFRSQTVQLNKYEKRYIHKSGATVWGLVTARSVKLESDNSNTLFSVVEDINEARLMAAELKTAQATLVNSLKMASLGEMASGIAHEINNPLAIIQSNASTLLTYIKENQFNSENGIKKLEKIITTSGRIAKIILGLRSFSRNAEKDPFESISLRSLIENVLSFCSEKFRLHEVTLDISPIPELAFECRMTQIEQVLLNLLNNAHDAVENLTEKWVRLNVTVKSERLEISVTDSGNGIPAEVVEKMMQPFFTTKEIGKGTGLGLSISKGIIEDHLGQLKYDPHSQNTRFVIEMPLKHS